jgi:serine/threonine protein kinase
MEISRGSYVAERYQILENASETMPAYLAEDRSNRVGSLQVLVSLRILDPNLFNLIQLEDRIKSLRTIKNDHIIRIFDLVKGPNLLAVSTERLSGVCLAQEIKTTHYSSYEVALKLWQIAKGIETLHIKGVIHGALNEDAIYVWEDGKCKIDPLIPNTANKFDSVSDIKALGLIGEKLSKGPPYKSKIWYRYSKHDLRLSQILEQLKKGAGGARYFRAELEKLLIEENFNTSNLPRLTYVFSAKLAIAIFIALQLIILTFLCFAALHPHYFATLWGV